MKKHIEEFFKLKCAPDLLAWKLFPNAKEVTESMAAFEAVRNIVMTRAGINYKSTNVKLICVGDGVVPRTAALFATRTAWDCYSIDPMMRDFQYPVKRLQTYKNKIEELDFNFKDDIIVIVCVHSHATIKNILAHIHGKERHLVTIPCCVPHVISNKSYIGYADANIWSEKNEIKVWINI